MGNVASRTVDGKCMRRSPRLASHDLEAQNSKTNGTFVQVHASLILFFFFHIYFLLDVYFSAYIFGVIYSTVAAHYLLGNDICKAQEDTFLAEN